MPSNSEVFTSIGQRPLLEGGRRSITIGVVTGFALILLAGCQSSTTLSKEDLVGIWRSNGGVYVQFHDDGTLIAAWTFDGLTTSPLEKATYQLEGTRLTWIPDPDSPGCKDVGQYEASLGEEGELHLSKTEDSCSPRASDLGNGPMRPYSP